LVTILYDKNLYRWYIKYKYEHKKVDIMDTEMLHPIKLSIYGHAVANRPIALPKLIPEFNILL